MNPVVVDDDSRRRWYYIGGGLAIILLLLGAMVLVKHVDLFDRAGADDETCGTEPQFYAYDAEGNNFGPASTSNSSGEQVQELQRRLCNDPALAVATEQYLNGTLHVGNQNRVDRTQLYISTPWRWREAVDGINERLDECTASLATMGGGYQTLAMQKGADRNVIPTVFQVTPDAPQFRVLRFDCTGGQQFNFKLNCGFQPVEQNFPGVPRESVPPSASYTPPGSPPPGTTPTTRPPGGCPTGPDGCKDPNDSISHDPATCALGDCGPRPVPPTPPPADPVPPTPQVDPPANPPPPPDDPGPTQPPVTGTIPTPDTAPG